ncbi:MAG: hypothetical protein ACE5IR_15320 [bacterium]
MDIFSAPKISEVAESVAETKVLRFRFDPPVSKQKRLKQIVSKMENLDTNEIK